MEEIRIQKFLAEAGIASRRKCEEFISQGKVMVNGKVAILGMKINSKKDNVLFEGRKVTIKDKKVYILLNKPVGYVTTVSDEYDRDKVMDLIDIKERVVPVGRLDMYTSGALILSNDGKFIYQITHPKHEIEKTYIASVKGQVSEEQIQKLEQGVEIENYVTSPAKVRILNYNKGKNQSDIEITIHEGKNRQVRKMLETIGKETLKLHRSKIRKCKRKRFKRRYVEVFKPSGSGQIKKIVIKLYCIRINETC